MILVGARSNLQRSYKTNQYTSEWIFNDQVNMISFLMKRPNTHVSSLNWLTDSWCIAPPGLTEPRCWSDDRPRVIGYGAWPSRRTVQTLWNRPSVLQNNKFIYINTELKFIVYEMKNTLQHNTQQNIINVAIHQKSY